MKEQKNFMRNPWLYVVMLLVLGLMAILSQTNLAAQNESDQYYKMLSALEYSGTSQFRNEIETLYAVKRLASADDTVKYILSTNEKGNKEISFVIDSKTQKISATGTDMAFLETVSNQCANSLKRVTKTNVGKTWKQSFDLSTVGGSAPKEIKFTLTAIQVKTESLGDVIAVRALSEPFSVNVVNEKGGAGSLQCKINSVYVFDKEFKDIYLSLSLFRATTNINGFNETLQHTVATRMTDADGKAADFSDLGKNKDFDKFVSKLGITNKLEVVNAASLPQWAKSEGIKTAQVANICAGTSCEGALNPAASVFMPAARVVELQGSSEPITKNIQLAGTGGGSGNMFEWFGWNIPTVIWAGGVTFGTLGAAGAFNETETKYRSPAD